MVTTVEQGSATESGFGSLTTTQKIRFVLFSLAVLALAGLNVALTPREVIGAGVLGWFQSYGAHQIHDMVISPLLVLGVVVPALLVLYHPRRRVNTILAPVVGILTVAVLAFLADSPLLTGFAVSAVLALVALALHPAGRSLFRFERADRVDRRVAALYVIGAVPLLAYAGLELLKQIGPADPMGHVAFVHYGGMAVSAFLVVLMGGLAVFRDRDWRYPTWFAGLLAGFIGIVSIAWPTLASSVGVVGGALMLAWALAFVAGVEYTRRGSETETDELSRQRPAGAA
ncbi:hypothetical protein ACFQGE_14265 [Halomicroarcula sp. GCM10025817]|uniref:hypothetical protein n=1 Tax=Haloarcula TaxID=2237 RepID=UPI0023E84862|nr:hypothetical protein [Halomicroarcula sp. SYNS111]